LRAPRGAVDAVLELARKVVHERRNRRQIGVEELAQLHVDRTIGGRGLAGLAIARDLGRDCGTPAFLKDKVDIGVQIALSEPA